MKIVQIVGLGHSGTTVIDRIMACHPRVAGLGESSKAFFRRDKPAPQQGTCSCQCPAQECPIWSRVLGRSHANMSEFYSAIVAAAGECGFEALSDSSKEWAQVAAYRKLQQTGQVDRISLLRVIRDPRGWVQSAMRSLKIGSDDRDNIRMLFFRWLLLSLKLDARVANAKMGCGHVWYDRLILDQAESALAGLFDLPPLPEEGVDLAESKQHAITGNQFLKTDKRKTISYDASWLSQHAIEDVYSELAMVRDYYHLVQQLHLSRDRRLSNLPTVDHRALVAEAETANSAAPIEAALADLDVRLLLPA